jgi:uncharacterized iron-regulated membrane protein
MSIRKYFFWVHLTAGSIAGIVILVMCVTGVLLSFEKQIANWAERNVRHVRPAAGHVRQPVGTLVTEAVRGEASAPTSVIWHAEPESTVEIGFGRERSVFVNPYTGERLGEGAVRLRGFFMSVEEVHRWLAAGGEWKPRARATTGAANLLFLFLACSGLYLWWPRSWSASSLRAVTWFRGNLEGKARDFNWHNTIGFWSCVPLIAIVTCSVVMSYPWANNLVYRLTGSPAPTANLNARAVDQKQTRNGAFDPNELNLLCARAENKVPRWQTISLRLPTTPADANAAFTIDAGEGGRPDQRAQLVLRRISGDEVRWEPFSSNSRGRRWRIWMRFTHTGEAFGVIGQAIAGIASLGGVFLVYTGISLAVRRFFAWRARDKSDIRAALSETSCQQE